MIVQVLFLKINFHGILERFFNMKSYVFFQLEKFPFKMYLMISSLSFSLFFLSETTLSQIINYLICLITDFILSLFLASCVLDSMIGYGTRLYRFKCHLRTYHLCDQQEFLNLSCLLLEQTNSDVYLENCCED